MLPQNIKMPEITKRMPILTHNGMSQKSPPIGTFFFEFMKSVRNPPTINRITPINKPISFYNPFLYVCQLYLLIPMDFRACEGIRTPDALIDQALYH